VLQLHVWSPAASTSWRLVEPVLLLSTVQYHLIKTVGTARIAG